MTLFYSNCIFEYNSFDEKANKHSKCSLLEFKELKGNFALFRSPYFFRHWPYVLVTAEFNPQIGLLVLLRTHQKRDGYKEDENEGNKIPFGRPIYTNFKIHFIKSLWNLVYNWLQWIIYILQCIVCTYTSVNMYYLSVRARMCVGLWKVYVLCIYLKNDYTTWSALFLPFALTQLASD